MMPDRESRTIRAVLRDAHEGDEMSCPPFRRLVGDPRRTSFPGLRTLRAAAIGAMAALTSTAVVVLWRNEDPPPRPASAAAQLTLPLDFLLELPTPAPAEALPSLRVPHRR